VGFVAALEGDVLIRHDWEAEYRPAEIRNPVHEGDRLGTGDDGKAKIHFEDETVLVLGKNSELMVARYEYRKGDADRKALLALLRGKVWFEVTKFFRQRKVDFQLETSSAMVGVRGTEGILRTQSPTWAYCLTGMLLVENPSTGESLDLGPMRKAWVERGRPMVVAPITPGEARELRGEFEMSPSPSRGAAGAGGPDDPTAFYVACVESSGRVTVTDRMDAGAHQPMAGPFRGPSEAERWVAENCPSEACDAFGRCFRPPAGDVIRRFTEREGRRTEEVTTRSQGDQAGAPPGPVPGGTGVVPLLPDAPPRWTHEGKPPGDHRGHPAPDAPPRPPTGDKPPCPGGNCPPAKAPTAGVKSAKPPPVTASACKSNSDCWSRHRSSAYFCNPRSGQCVACPPGQHGRKDGSPSCHSN
jgi:hypothetical protein